jgi:hypothetical protein
MGFAGAPLTGLHRRLGWDYWAGMQMGWSARAPQGTLVGSLASVRVGRRPGWAAAVWAAGGPLSLSLFSISISFPFFVSISLGFLS